MSMASPALDGAKIPSTRWVLDAVEPLTAADSWLYPPRLRAGDSITSGSRSMMFHKLSPGMSVRAKSRFIPPRNELRTGETSGTEVDPRPCERAPVASPADVHRPDSHTRLAQLGDPGIDDTGLPLLL